MLKLGIKYFLNIKYIKIDIKQYFEGCDKGSFIEI